MADDFFDTPGFHKHANWIILLVAAITLLVLALPFIWAFTDWL